MTESKAAEDRGFQYDKGPGPFLQRENMEIFPSTISTVSRSTVSISTLSRSTVSISTVSISTVSRSTVSISHSEQKHS
jgi:hypothetical protein